jgi:hypothetical protein
MRGEAPADQDVDPFFRCASAFRQGLKPAHFLRHSCTTEVVPCYKARNESSFSAAREAQPILFGGKYGLKPGLFKWSDCAEPSQRAVP